MKRNKFVSLNMSNPFSSLRQATMSTWTTKQNALGKRAFFSALSARVIYSTTLGSHSEIAGMYVTAISTRNSAT